MKKITFVFTLLLGNLLYAQYHVDNTWAETIKPIFANLDQTKIPHGILLDYAMEFTDVNAYNGEINETLKMNAHRFGQIYKTLYMGNVLPDTTYFPSMKYLATQWASQRLEHNAEDRTLSTLVLAGLHYQYAQLDTMALEENRIQVIENRHYEDAYVNGVWQNPYEVKETIALTAPISHLDQLEFEVLLPRNLFLTNSPEDITQIEINFDDGLGYREVVFDEKLRVAYETEGTKNWQYKLTSASGHHFFGFFGFTVFSDPCEGIDNCENLPGATLRIDYAGDNTEITRPFIVAEGFDTGHITAPETFGGDVTLDDDFLNSIRFSGSNDLEDILFEDYDIIYIDWKKGTDNIKNNSAVLEGVLDWVNQEKTTEEPNVLLGQSMGGVIGRYTLARMEQENKNHDVRLFISHDAPHQGANTPLGIQYFSRHFYNEYVSRPGAVVLGEQVVPYAYALAELMSHAINLFGGNTTVNPYVSPHDILTLQDTPAAVQMNYEWVTFDEDVTTILHDAWQDEYEAMGYPTQSRNIAISNGNQCGEGNDFVAGDPYIIVDDYDDPQFWGDLVHLAGVPALGLALGDINLSLLGGLIPGESKFHFKFHIKSTANSNMVYHGRIYYKKRVLWFGPEVVHVITGRDKYAKFFSLPYGSYSGGTFDVSGVSDDLPDFFPPQSLVNPEYGFIPVVSALDIQRTNNSNNLYQSDYSRAYGAHDILSQFLHTEFINYIVDYHNGPINSEHISFQTRNGDWLAEELDDPANINFDFDCSEFCNPHIDGDPVICDTETYSVPASATTVVWSITQGGHLVNHTINANAITINYNHPTDSGFVTIQATFVNNNCGGQRTIERDVWVGEPDTSNTSIQGGHANVSLMMTSMFAATPPTNAPLHYYDWEIIHSNVNCTGTNVTYPMFYNHNNVYSSTYTSTSPTALVDWGTCPGTYLIRCRLRNKCGSKVLGQKNVNVYDPNGEDDPCDGNYPVVIDSYPNPANRTVPINVTISRPEPLPCDGLTDPLGNPINNRVLIFNMQGHVQFDQNYEVSEFTINDLDLAVGHYIMRVATANELYASEIIVIEE